jgi:hypothetical protein
MPATPGVLKLHWTIAQDYYLYRGRMKFKAATASRWARRSCPMAKSTTTNTWVTWRPITTASTPRCPTRWHPAPRTEVERAVPGLPRSRSEDLLSAAYRAIGSAAAGRCQCGAWREQTRWAHCSLKSASCPAFAQASIRRRSAAARRTGVSFRGPGAAPHHLLLRWTMPKGYYLYRDQTTLNR